MHEKLEKGIQTPKKKSLLSRSISTLLIVIGLALIAMPIIGKVLTDQKQQNLMDDFYLELENDQISSDPSANTQLDEALIWGSDVENQDEINQDVQEVGSIQPSDAIIKSKPKAIGVVQIDKIKLKLPIAEGVSLEVLNFAVGHMPGTAALGDIGNSVLAGHRNHTFGSFFNRLDEVVVGDVIKVEKGDGSFTTYEVYEKLFVQPDDLSVLNGSSKYKILTLITCHPEINPTQRLILHAKEKI